MKTPTDKVVTSLYCGRADMIVPLNEEGLCRACHEPAGEGDGTHRRLTPTMLKRMGYVTTPAPDAAASRRVLCVDNRASRNLAVFLLRRAGYEVVTAKSLPDALESARGARFDLYLINHKFLQGAGRELYDKLSAATPRTPILFYSTVTYPFRRRRAGGPGVGGGRTKPVPVTEVAGAVSKLLSREAGDDDARDVATKARSGGLSTGAKVLAGAGVGAAVLFLGALVRGRRGSRHSYARP